MALLAVGLTACAREKAPGVEAAAPPATRKTVSDFFPIKVGDRIVRMQLAVLMPEMQRGLMERRDLGRDDGMIFIYDRPQQMSFWMRHTPTALDIGFFRSDGTLAEIYPMYPFDENTVASHSSELRFALELNQGWYRGNGVKPGDKIDVKALADALRARGFAPGKFGL